MRNSKKYICLAALVLTALLSACAAEVLPENVVTPEPTENPVPPPAYDDEPTATPAQPQSQPQPEPQTEPTLVFDPSALSDMPHADEYTELRQDNSQVCAWITVPNTAIDYPAALGTDNEHYLHTTLKGEESKAGAIFFDYRTDPALSSRHIILYGHNMRAGTMFHDLGSYKYKEFFDNNRLITLYAGSEKRTYEVFAAYIAEPGTYFIRMFFNGDEHFLQYFGDLQAKSKFSTDTVLSKDDQVLTLCTCTYEVDDARFVVHARLVK